MSKDSDIIVNALLESVRELAIEKYCNERLENTVFDTLITRHNIGVREFIECVVKLNGVGISVTIAPADINCRPPNEAIIEALSSKLANEISNLLAGSVIGKIRI